MTLSRFGRTIVLVASLAVAGGCRQSDGMIPQPQGEQANKTMDVGRDLLNVAARSEGAEIDLFDDISNLSTTPPPQALMKEMTTALNDAVAGTSPTQEAAQRLAETLFTVLTARDLSRRQIEQLQVDVTERTRETGAPEAAAVAVGNVAAKIQGEITANKRRWYHFF